MVFILQLQIKVNMHLFNIFLNFYNNKYYIGPAVLTTIFSFVLLNPYSANANFDMVATFFGYLITTSSILAAIFLHQVLSGKKELLPLFSASFCSLSLSMMALTFCKTHSFLSHLAITFAIVAIFVFFSIFKMAASIISEQ